MPKRNLVWIALAAVIAVLLWKVPPNVARRDALYNQFSPLLDVRAQVRRNYVESIDDEVLLRGAIDGMLNRLDPYSEYYDAAEFEQVQKRTEGQFTGIGIEVVEVPGGGLEIVSPIEGSPAFLAGLRAGDRIIEVEGRRTIDLTLVQAVRLISGPPGTSVTLTIRRPTVLEALQKTITRSVVTVRTVRGWSRSENWDWDYLIDPERRIGYVRISSFEGHTHEQLDAAMKDLLNRHQIQGLVLDVRDNPGGLLDVVVQIANRFLSGGRIVSTQGRYKAEKPFMASPGQTYPAFPMVVLVNQGSASASEILAGALKDHGRATIVGEQTFGKGSVQELIKIDNGGGAVKLTTAHYYLPKGERIHGRGVVPDKIVDLTPQERTALIESQLAVYSTSLTPATTQAGEDDADVAAPRAQIDISADRQLQEALDLLRAELTTQPAG
jgi:carboxyl-terminal processing protease